MSLDFPGSPTQGDTYTFGDITYEYDGTKWVQIPPSFLVTLDDVTTNGNTTTNSITTGGLTSNGNIDVNDNDLEQANIKDASEEVYAHGSVSGAVTVDYTNGGVQTMTITGATTLTFSNPPSSGKAGWLTIMITNGDTNVTFPASVDWGDAGAPTLQATGLDIVSFLTIDAGTNWYGLAGYTG